MAKTMSIKQVEHLSMRLNEEIGKAVAKLKAELPNNGADRFTTAQKVKAIRSGTATLTKDKDLDYYTRLVDAFTYHGEAKIIADLKSVQGKVDALEKKLLAKKQVIMDKAILGGADEALAALQEFVKNINK